MLSSMLRAVALVLAGLASTPVVAFEGLERLLRMTPDLGLASPTTSFHYLRTRETFESGVQAVDAGNFHMALRMPEEFRSWYGIEADAVQEHVITGDPPNTLIYVRLAPGMMNALTDTLNKRGLERRKIGPHVAFASGDDYGMNPGARRLGDPFGGMLGLSQRFMVRDDVLVVARGWPDVSRVTAVLDGERPATTTLIAASIPALRDAVGSGSVATQAVLYPLPALAGASVSNEALEALAAGRTPRLSSGGAMPLFLAAWLLTGTHGKDSFAAVATLYGDQSIATLGAAEIARRLRGFSTGEGAAPTYELKVQAVGAAWMGVVVARFANQPLARADTALRTWNDAVMTKQFVPLDPMR